MSAEPPPPACVGSRAPRWGKQAWRAAFASMVPALVAQLAAAPVRADSGPRRASVRIELTRGPGAERCPDERFLRAAIARRMGFDPFDAEASLTMAASIEQAQGELIASAYLRDRRGVVLWADRYTTHGDCKALVSTVALSIAVQLDDTGELPPPQAAPAPHEEPATPAEAPCSPERPCAGPPAPPPSEAPPARSPGKAAPARDLSRVRAPPPSSAGQAAAERFRWTVGAGATMALGLTPGVAVGPTLAVAGRWPAWSIALEARGLSSLSTSVDEARVATSAFTANVALCLHRHSLFACGVGEIGMLRAVPELENLTGSLLNARVGVGARVGVTWPFSESLSGCGTVEAVQRLVDSSILRRKGITESQRPVWSAPATGVAFGIGLQMNL
ncbi:hypothetical protein WMF45_06505 [Sorangium sp. So ce448]|uniref:hypothetical protein n=1 Tax=Sorangium sp. So ce448 TaxID=3133314 RepID=UPI003F5FBED6